MKTIKKIRNIGMIVASIFILIIVISSIINPPDDSLKDLYPDLDSFRIENLTEEQILKVDNTFKAYKSSIRRSGKGSGLPLKYEDEDRDKISFSAKKVNGIKLISVTSAKDCKLQLNINSKVVSGNAKIVVVTDKTGFEFYDVNKELIIEYDVQGQHEYYVKLLAENAEAEIQVQRVFS